MKTPSFSGGRFAFIQEWQVAIGHPGMDALHLHLQTLLLHLLPASALAYTKETKKRQIVLCNQEIVLCIVCLFNAWTEGHNSLFNLIIIGILARATTVMHVGFYNGHALSVSKQLVPVLC